jgi:DNA-binding transcriptional ArsR family regulator
MNPDYSRQIPDAWRAVSDVFFALGDPHRQRILLTFERDEELNVSQIVSVSTLSRPAVSHHLKILRDAGILVSEKRGKEVFFRINKNYILETFENVENYISSNL